MSPSRESSRRQSRSISKPAREGSARREGAAESSPRRGRQEGGSALVLTGSHIYNFLNCRHLLYLDQFGDPGLMDPESDLEETLREKGKLHEEAALKALGLRIAEVDCENFDDAAQQTLRLMKAGEKWIYQGCLSAPAMHGSPDLLKRTRGESRLGSYHYIPLELKSGSAYENEENGTVKRHYALQLAFYAHLLGKVQGLRPEMGKVIGGDFRTVDFDLEECRMDYEEAIATIRAILSHKVESEPEISSSCGQCHWRSCCFEWARKADDLTLIRKLSGEARGALRAAGIMTISGLASLERRKDLPAVRGITPHKLRHLVRRAGVMKRGAPLLRSAVEFPKAAVELFFDIETDPEQGLCYLYGIVERRGEKLRYVSFFADSPADERKAWGEFWKYVSGLDDFHMYHYSQYERKELAKLAERHHCNQKLFERLFENCTDLYQDVVDKHTDWPSPSYSIKAVSKILGFRYSDLEPGGLKAAKWYAAYVANPTGNAELKRKLLRYNEEDCLAMMVLKDWVAAESKKVNRQGELVF